MAFDELKWERNTSLRDMMSKFDAVVDIVAGLAQDFEHIREDMAAQREEISAEHHEIEDIALTANYKADKVCAEMELKSEDLLRLIKRMHPES